MREPARWFVLAAAVALLDQLVKWIVLAQLVPGERIAVTEFFNLVLVYNRGAAFSFLAQASGWQTPVLVAFAAVAAVVVSVLIVRSPGKRMLCAGFALILAGAIGNVIDRLRYGHVVDFLDFHALGWHWPAFNVADSAITIGAALVILDGFRQRENAAPSAERGGTGVRK